jgi:drug/metabolite transporter (DMT)-like permease
MLYEIISKLLSESLLSLYPIFVKNIGLPLLLQTWSRCFSYAIISSFFIDYAFVLQTMATSSGILLSLVTIAHIYTSYRGFQLLESGIAYSIFYLYPIMILLMANKKIHPILLLALVGVFLLVSDEKFNIANIIKSPEGVIMILLAAFTEAIIYFLVRDIKTENNWNHIFISYFFGAILLSMYFFKNIMEINFTGRLSLSLGVNLVIGLFGYLLRFFAISRLDTVLYASLSYFGIFMAFVYGVLVNNESINLKKILGSLFIIISNYFLL